MERVQFQQEEMLAELKDLVQKGLFTLKETKLIMKKRTEYETALVRRIAKKSDFLRYAAYEMGLEKLRRKRVERLNLPPSPPTVSDYALVRRQFHIFERALKKFRADIGLWIEYIQIAKKEGARALVGRITARALQIHPNSPALYILAAAHELDHLSPSAARSLLQRGIRLNPDSVDLWREYVKMELSFIESLRRRWDVLGINRKDPGQGPDEAGGAEALEADDEQGAAARREVMGGAIVKSVITSATKAVPKIDLFVALHMLLNDYPTLPSLRTSLLEHVYDLARSTLPADPKAIKFVATRALDHSLTGDQLVAALEHANQELLGAIPAGCTNEDMFRMYAEFVEEWCARDIDEHLKLYLIGSLGALIRRTVEGSPSLLATHVRMLMRARQDPAKTLRAARKYTRQTPHSGCVWLARLAAEKEYGSRKEAEEAWAEARKLVQDDEVWTWGLEQYGDDSARSVHERLLGESMGDASLRDVHELLLMRYAARMPRTDQGDGGAGARTALVRHMGRAYLTSGRVWQRVFEAEEDLAVARAVYEEWRRVDAADAAAAWAGRQLAAGDGRAAVATIVDARSSLGGAARSALDSRWAAHVATSAQI